MNVLFTNAVFCGGSSERIIKDIGNALDALVGANTMIMDSVICMAITPSPAPEA